MDQYQVVMYYELPGSTPGLFEQTVRCCQEAAGRSDMMIDPRVNAQPAELTFSLSFTSYSVSQAGITAIERRVSDPMKTLVRSEGIRLHSRMHLHKLAASKPAESLSTPALAPA